MLPEAEAAISDSPTPRTAPPSTANLFAVGALVRGVLGKAYLITSIARKASLLGPRTADTAFVHDTLDEFFREGGKVAYVSRGVGDAAATADGVLEDFAGDPAFNVTASGPGAFGNDVDVEVIGGGTASSGEDADAAFSFEVSYQGAVVEVTPQFEDKADAESWFVENSRYARLEAVGHDAPEAGTLSLAGGVDDNNLTPTKIGDALEAFPPEMGAGQVCVPGFTSSAVHDVLLAHAESVKRTPLCDGLDTATADDLAAAAIARRSTVGHQRGAVFAPWDRVPGVVPGTTRKIPPCGRIAALHARALEQGLGVGDPVAGEKLPAQYAVGPVHEWSRDDRELLNDAGVNVSRVIDGKYVCDGNRTLTSAIDEPNWAQLSQARVITSLAAEGRDIGRAYVHSKVDGQGLTVGEFVGRLQILCGAYHKRGDLYGDTPQEAYTIVPSVDLDEADAEILASIEARVSKGAGKVRIDIYKTPVA